MEVSGEPRDSQPSDTPEQLLARPWLEKFRVWKALIRNGCPALANLLCMWLGISCSFNNCPRRSFEEEELYVESAVKVENQQRRIAELKQRLAESQNQVKELKKRLQEK